MQTGNKINCLHSKQLHAQRNRRLSSNTIDTAQQQPCYHKGRC